MNSEFKCWIFFSQVDIAGNGVITLMYQVKQINRIPKTSYSKCLLMREKNAFFTIAVTSMDQTIYAEGDWCYTSNTNNWATCSGASDCGLDWACYGRCSLYWVCSWLNYTKRNLFPNHCDVNVFRFGLLNE